MYKEDTVAKAKISQDKQSRIKMPVQLLKMSKDKMMLKSYFKVGYETRNWIFSSDIRQFTKKISIYPTSQKP